MRHFLKAMATISMILSGIMTAVSTIIRQVIYSVSLTIRRITSKIKRAYRKTERIVNMIPVDFSLMLTRNGMRMRHFLTSPFGNTLEYLFKTMMRVMPLFLIITTIGVSAFSISSCSTGIYNGTNNFKMAATCDSCVVKIPKKDETGKEDKNLTNIKFPEITVIEDVKKEDGSIRHKLTAEAMKVIIVSDIGDIGVAEFCFANTLDRINDYTNYNNCVSQFP